MRRPDWKEQLWAVLEAAKNREFHYGACVELAAECVDAMTGSAFRAAIAPLVLAAQESPISLEELERVTTGFAGAPIALNWADQGDVMLLEFPRPSGPALGICTGARIACAALDGVAYIKRERAIQAWKIA